MAPTQAGQRETDNFLLLLRYQSPLSPDDKSSPSTYHPQRDWPAETILEDLKTAANAGFSQVVIDPPNSESCLYWLESAKRVGLKILFTDPSLNHYVRLGVKPKGVNDLKQLVGRLPAEITTHTAFGGWFLDACCSDATTQRTQEVARKLFHHSLQSALVGSQQRLAEVHLDHPMPLEIYPRSADAQPAAMSPLARWLASYHAELAQGRTGGVILIRQPMPTPRLDTSAEAITNFAARATARRMLLERISRWGRRLLDFTAKPMEGLSSGCTQLKASLLSRGRRQYLFLYNADQSRYCRSQVSWLIPQEEINLKRAVEIPATPGRSAGRVITATRSGFSIGVNLRPGDASLFELF